MAGRTWDWSGPAPPGTFRRHFEPPYVERSPVLAAAYSKGAEMFFLERVRTLYYLVSNASFDAASYCYLPEKA